MALSCGIYVTSAGCGWLRLAAASEFPDVNLASKTLCFGAKYWPKSDKMICKNAPDQSCRSIFDNPSITFGLFFGNASEPQDLKNDLAEDGR